MHRLSSIRAVIDKARKTSASMSKRIFLRSEYQRAAKRVNTDVLGFKLMLLLVGTRWYSTNVMLKKYLKNKKVMKDFFGYMPSNGKSAAIREKLKETEECIVHS